MVVNSKSAPTFVGVQKPGLSPRGTKTTPKRVSGFAAVWAMGVIAGAIASRNGRATVAPMPRKTARREICFFML